MIIVMMIMILPMMISRDGFNDDDTVELVRIRNQPKQLTPPGVAIPTSILTTDVFEYSQ